MSRMLRASSWILSLLGLCAVAAVLMGRGLSTTIMALDPLHGSSRDIALLDFPRSLSVRLTYSPDQERSPVWSPDGAQLAYLSIADGIQQLYIANANGTNRRMVISTPSGEPDTAAIAWSPDGRYLALTALMGARQSLLLFDLETGTEKLLTSTDSSASTPSWSPDGQKLVFAWSLVANQDIFIADVTQITDPLQRETEVERVTSDYGMDAMPAWSPDGQRIAFVSTRDGDSNVYLLDTASGTLNRMTYNAARDTAPSWTPDGQHLLFRSDRDHTWAVYSINIECLASDRCVPVHLLDGELNPAWRP